MPAATATDKKAVLRDKRAQGIAAMGLVKREGDRFQVQTPSLRGRRTAYEVWRDETGKVRCTCLEFEEHTAEDAGFRCEHILAVKHAIIAKNSESAATPPVISVESSAASAIEPKQVAASTTTCESAPEKPAAPPAVSLAVPSSTTTVERATADMPAVAPSFGRELDEFEIEDQDAEDEPQPVFTSVSNLRSLAEHTHEEEQHNMKNEVQPQVLAAETEHSDSVAEMTPTTEAIHGAPVVPLAFTNTLRTLRQPIDNKLIKTREGWTDRQGNKHQVEYVEWHTVADLLDRITPTWSHAVRGIVQIGDMVAVTAAITIDNVTREGVGTGTADNETGIKKAEHDALKRAAIKFGIARDLYQRESEVIERQGSAPDAGEFPRDPLAKSMADLVTPKQLGMIRALAREAGVEVDEECQSVLRCKTDELSKRAASSFIDHLKGKTQEAAAATSATMRRAS